MDSGQRGKNSALKNACGLVLMGVPLIICGISIIIENITGMICGSISLFFAIKLVERTK